jgi:alpha-tubulin suppressor-like RCC1 family protein
MVLIAAAMAVSGACTSSGSSTTDDGAIPGRVYLMVGLSGVQSVTTGDRHSCALRTTGTAVCWGSNRFGELGNGQDGIQTWNPFRTPVVNLTGAVGLSTGSDHTCAVLNDGTASCWGANGNGQLGNTNPADAVTPTAVQQAPNQPLTNVSAIAAGGSFTCALIVGGQVECWGANSYGQLGNGKTADSSTPTAVSGISDATAITLGTWSACAIRTGGAVSCWGYAGVPGLLGDGTQGSGTYSDVPVSVQNLSGSPGILSGATAVAIRNTPNMDDGNVCASRDDHTVVCWGNKYLGDGTANASLSPVQVSDMTNGTGVSGAAVLCALRSDGQVGCWGDGTKYGLLGGRMVIDLTPYDMHHLGNFGSPGVLQLGTGTGGYESCAVMTDHSVMCWGITAPPGVPF